MHRYPFASDYAAALAGPVDPDAASREEQLAYQDPFPGAPRSSRPFLPAGLAAAPLPRRLAPEVPAVLPRREVPADVAGRMYKYRPAMPDNKSLAPDPYLEMEQSKSPLHRESDTLRPEIVEFDARRVDERMYKPGSRAHTVAGLTRLRELFDGGSLTKSEFETLVRALTEPARGGPDLPRVNMSRAVPDGCVVPGGGVVPVADGLLGASRALDKALAASAAVFGQALRPARSATEIEALVKERNADIHKRLAAHRFAAAEGVRDQKVTSVNPGIPRDPAAESLSAVFPHRRPGRGRTP